MKAHKFNNLNSKNPFRHERKGFACSNQYAGGGVVLFAALLPD